MQAIWRGQVIADSNQTIEVDGYHYFPRAAVRMELLQLVAKNQSDRACPNGVQFYDVGDGDSRSARAAWSYEAPRASMQKVDHYLGFWNDVELKP